MPSIYSILRRRSASAKLAQVFERSEASTGRALPIRRTGRGIWAATPVRVVEAAVKTLHGIGLLGDGGQPGHVIDAGTGDGRVPAVLQRGARHARSTASRQTPRCTLRP